MKNSPEILRPLFQLDSEITFLNHGSYGSCPKPVFDVYQDWQRKLEARPIKFMSEDVYEYLATSRQALGQYINCDKDDLVYMPNPTHAVANIIHNLDLGPGDEVLTTNLEYGACERAWTYDAEQRGYVYVKSEISFPIVDKESFCREFWNDATDHTKYIFISHITSGTGLILPIPEIVAEAKKRGIGTIIDGAHAPAHIPLDITELDPDYYTGACHKWLCAPKGSSFLYVKKERQEGMQPLVISWGWGGEYNEFKASTELHSPSLFVNIFQWQGTRDMSAFLTIPAAIQFQEKYNWEEAKERSRDLVRHTRDRINDCTGLAPICPEDWLGQMATILFPMDDPQGFKNTLYDAYKIEIPVITEGNLTAVRVSFNGYNSQADADRLADVLKKLI
ncbi:MAG: aminotransferase class V-fold PLP-dependent enzyme [Candidatus Marinimicrobia bacterium]|nr:aminotransferase class V-fold PLP-dependent enzyme [Candidatus Neomarinimicrobiota bacterium]